MKTPLEPSSKRATRAPQRDAKRKPTIAIIGAGRVGTWLALALSARGYPIAALVARRAISARRAARLIRSASTSRAAQTLKTLTATQLDELPAAIDLFLITTPDDEIKTAAAQLAKAISDAPRSKKSARGKINARDKTSARGVKPVALHASGALTSDELKILRERGFSVGSLHPLIAVSGSQSGAKDLARGAFFCIEGDRAAQTAARRLVRDLEGHSFTTPARHKSLYHAAAVTASGHAVALFDLAVEMLSRSGLSKTKAHRVLLPLLRTTLENLSAQTTSRALTGTFARADAATARKHLDALRAEKNLDEAMIVYTLLGKRALTLAAKNGVSRAALKKVARALNE